jgi:hypothetical protein
VPDTACGKALIRAYTLKLHESHLLESGFAVRCQSVVTSLVGSAGVSTFIETV